MGTAQQGEGRLSLEDGDRLAQSLLHLSYALETMVVFLKGKGMAANDVREMLGRIDASRKMVRPIVSWNRQGEEEMEPQP